MMDFGNVSPVIYFITEDDNAVEFRKYRFGDEKKPSPDECKGKLRGIRLDYACCGEQDWGIEPMARAFGCKGNNGIIHKIPLELVEEKGVRAIKFGNYAQLDDQMVRRTKEAGIIGYWDDSNLIICAAPEYGFVIDSIKELFKPKRVRFAFNRSFAGSNLLILAI